MSDKADRRHQVGKWLRLHLSNQVGPITFARLLKHFGNIDRALAAGPAQLADVPGIAAKTAQTIVASRDNLDVETELELAQKLAVQIITIESEKYPTPLRQLPDPPPVLYVKGRWIRQDAMAIALVGSRNCSQYGYEQASRLSHLLAAAGFTIVSGLARGIDTAAHRGALAADGRTIAVQGCGLAKTYPAENADLAQRIAENGAVMSELPLNFEPLPTTFPMRNRIISGLALATIVIEARPGSGALITARLALEQNREVMALPGRVDAPGSFGPHQLIKEGAKLVQGIEDILDALGHIGHILKDHAKQAATKAQQEIETPLFDRSNIKLTDTESALLECIDHQPLHIDELISRTTLAAGAANAALTCLQLKGLIKQLPGSFYRKA